jgi:cyclophilin family peptidyl-prolyl cis-trans isomerase
MKKKILIFFIFFGLFLLVGYFLQKELKVIESGQSKGNEIKPTPTIAPVPTQGLPSPLMIINPQKSYWATLRTSMGNIKIQLNVKATPRTANNFVYLARNNFYDQTIFHRVIKDFMIQGGDPKGDGTGGPGYFFDDEPFTGNYTRGTVAMANAGRNTNGSQFFIIHQDYQLPKNYVIFGKVVSGMEVVDKIATASVEMNAFGEESKPISPVMITSVEIIEK